jgi:integrase
MCNLCLRMSGIAQLKPEIQRLLKGYQKTGVTYMANLKSNALSVKKIEAEEKPASKKWIRDGGGLALCLTPAAIGPWRHWYYIYKSPETGLRVYKPLGSYPDIGLADARNEATKLKVALLAKVDPMAKERRDADDRKEADEQRRLSIEREAKEKTVADLYDDYFSIYVQKALKGWKKIKATLDKEVIPVIGKLKVKNVSADDLVAITSRIVKRGSPIQANRVHAYTAAMFSWGVDNRHIKSNPFKGIKKPVKAEPKRERTLSETELKEFWIALERDDLMMSAGVKVVLKLIVLTAQRPGEVAGMHTNEIDGNWWTIPGSRTKNGKTHRVYLTASALSLLADMKNKGYLFPSPVKAKEVISENALNYALRRNAKAPLSDNEGRPIYKDDGKRATENRLGVDHFTPHDLRRTAATILAKEKIPFEHRERVLNHTLGKLDAVYNQHDFDDEKQMAAETLGRRIQAILTGAKNNVIPIKKAA